MADGAGGASGGEGGYHYAQAYAKQQFNGKDIAALDKDERALLFQNYQANIAADAKKQGRDGSSVLPPGSNMFSSFSKLGSKFKGKKKATTVSEEKGEEQVEQVGQDDVGDLKDIKAFE